MSEPDLRGVAAWSRHRAGMVVTLCVCGALAAALPAWSQATSAAELAGGPAPSTAPQGDPWSGFNRGSYRVNGFLDRVLIGPVARGYKRVTPAPVRKGVGNVLSNLREPSTAVNALVQGRPKVSAKAVTRFLANSTVGLLGLFDVAGRGGLEREPADLGQTLGRYGVPQGPYIFLPVVGPTTVRDGLGGIVNSAVDPVTQAAGGPGSDFAVGRSVVRGVDARAELDETLRTVAETSTDPYATTRSAYLQSRAAVVREATGEVEALPDFDMPIEPDAPVEPASPPPQDPVPPSP